MEYVPLMMRCIVARDALAHASGQEMPCPALQRELGIFPVFVAVQTAKDRCRQFKMAWLGVELENPTIWIGLGFKKKGSPCIITCMGKMGGKHQESNL